MRTAVSAADTKRMIDKLLDKGYQQQAGVVLRSIAAQINGGVMKARFAQLQAEMQRLTDTGGKLQADNPVLRAFLADYATAVEKSAKAIDGAAPGLQQSAIDAAEKIVPKVTLPGFSDAQISAIWNQPDPEAVAKLIGFTDSPAWKQRLVQYSADTVQAIQDAAIRGIVGGKSPLAVGRDVSTLAQDIPLYQAQSMMRTLQMTSYRTANQAYGVANGDILSGQIRIAVLDPRTCLSCVALHGTELAIGERVDDHDQGRCTSVFVVRVRDVNVHRGQDWFENQSDETQSDMMGTAAYSAYKAGDVTLKDFIHPYQDAVFGQMIREASLTGILGADAQKYIQGARRA